MSRGAGRLITTDGGATTTTVGIGFPGRHWGPAWVSFAVGPAWIGWSPLGYHGGSVFAYDHGFYGAGRYPHHKGRRRYRGGKAVPRHVYDHGAGWNFSRKEHFGRRGRARLRASDVRSDVCARPDASTRRGLGFEP